jgi:phosphoribosyl 1,2-cyclic phosphodiesterase
VAIQIPNHSETSGIEIDFFPVGTGSKSGDAIVVRFGNLHGSVNEQRVIVIDGGYTDNGNAIIAHLRDVVGTEHVDLIISTHPDSDHVAGLRRVVDELSVDELWIHQPWDHTDGISELFDDSRHTDNSIGDMLLESLRGARELVEAAVARGVRVVEPFTGTSAFDGVVQVVGPDLNFYEALLVDFRGTPAPAA